MIEREFLGWDRPFLGLAVDWLLARREEMPRMLVVVPTAQGGRRLREALAERAGALLAPKVTVPGAFLRSRDEEAAPDWMEHVAWMEVLESVADWEPYRALFPHSPAAEAGWAGGLAREMVRLRHSLQENGLLIATGARKLSGIEDGERWAAMAKLEDAVERKLRGWDAVSRSALVADGVKMPAGTARIVLAGVADMPPLVERTFASWPGRVSALIGAPESEAESFSSIGRPLPVWAERPLPWPGGVVTLAADPRQQAEEALRIVGKCQTAPTEVALGSADAEVGDELARAFTRAGWTAFHPAAPEVTTGLARWFGVWREWLTDATLANMADLLALPETGVLVAGRRAQKARRLAMCRNRWMVIQPDDLRRRVDREKFRSEQDKECAERLCKAASTLETWRDRFRSRDFTPAMHDLLAALSRRGAATSESADTMAAWLIDAQPLVAKVDRGAGFWLDLMLSELPSPALQSPDGRVLDVQGWLEISHEPGRHLILCGMNEGSVPARGGGEPWLVEGSRKLLGLLPDATRAARDAYLFHAMLEARRDGGRVDVVCGKSGAGGESLLPSRLLLAGTRDELPGRVTQLFREVEPPEAGLRWHADWIWQTRAAAPPVKLGVTSLTDYLACPFRYYLKHVVKMQASDTARGEWNARDFGNVAHTVLERWGRDLTAREFEKTEAIYAWLSAELDRVVAEWFGKRVPLAVRIQTENLRQRLQWFARKQAVNCVEGWQVHDVERAVEIPFGEVTIMARIDRIDRHRDSGRLRVLDYKTGAVDGVEKAHRSQVSASTKLPNHVPPDCPVIHSAGRRGKPASVRWINLQLPLYAVALVGNGEPLPEPSYFTLGSTEADVGIQCWTDFDEVDLAAARDCAEWVVGKIAARTFWPPAEKVRYDDFAALTAGRPLEEMFAEPPAGGAQAGPRTLPLSQGGHSGSFRQRYPPHS